ncbi:MAG: NADH:flavin oxidoreductase [Alphaproteobacteria bacterium]|nr:NADH:flavin oxidoreductase [Alphaproteobacteria bacterium]
MSSLDQPLTLRSGLRLGGRVALAPLTNTQSHADGTLGDDELRWLLRRARGGFSWISTCAAWVSEEGQAWAGQLGIASDAHLPGLRRLAAALGAEGVARVVQLHHGGAKAEVAPRRLSTGGPEGARAATAADLAQVTEDFVAAALRAKEAGFDGVEVHGANGYLFTQFLAPADNPRTDAWGGDLEGRARLLRDTTRAIRAAVGTDFALGVRLSPVDHFARRGLVLADSVQVGRWLAEDGVDFVHLSLGDVRGAPPHEPEAGSIVRAFRDALPPDVALFAPGGIWTLHDAEEARALGVDVVVLGRAGIAHPDWPRASAMPEFAPHRPPWTREALVEVGVGPAFVDYLERSAGMVVGGFARR